LESPKLYGIVTDATDVEIIFMTNIPNIGRQLFDTDRTIPVN
jgi:hypothetical protein